MFIEYFPLGSKNRPVILLHGYEPEVVARLREQVAALAAERTQCVAVHEIPGFESVDGCRLFMKIGSSNEGTHSLRERQTFECQLQPIDWYNIEGLLEPFCDPLVCNGFQWLDTHGKMNLLISTSRGW